MYLVIDLETTGLPEKSYGEYYPHDQIDRYPYIVQVAWILLDSKLERIEKKNYIIKIQQPIPEHTTKIHGITNEMAEAKGVSLTEVLKEMKKLDFQILVSHNIEFDANILLSNCVLVGDAEIERILLSKKRYCTMKVATDILCIPGNRGPEFKYPSLKEMYEYYFPNEKFTVTHNASKDVEACAKCLHMQLSHLHPSQT
jgi:DNA polymerase III epsilon subunit-like protein